MSVAPKRAVVREVFSNSRLAEFASQQGLTSAIGYGPDEWPFYIVKELIDNALDDAEEHTAAPSINVEITQDRRIIVADQGSGLSVKILDRILDYNQRTSSREAYVSPTRGAQGNALQTILAIPFILDGTSGHVVIEARGEAHDIEFRIDPLTRTPKIRRRSTTSSVKIGTQISVVWPERASSYLAEAQSAFLPILANFSALNPHLSLSGGVTGSAVALDPTWHRRPACAPPSPHWYDRERFERLIAVYVAHGKGDRPVRDFVAEFAGLTGTVKRRAVLEASGLERVALRSLCPDGEFDHVTVTRLLCAMQAHSKPIKPEALGIIGRPHWEARAEALGGDTDTFKYHKSTGSTGGLPWMIESAFCHAPERQHGALVTGVNFSPSLRNPFQSLRVGYYPQSLDGMLASQYAGRDEPVIVFVHLVCPGASQFFTDRGKAGMALPPDISRALAGAVVTVTKAWCKQRTAEIRDRNAQLRRRAALSREGACRISIAEAASQVMGKAYAKASGGLPAKARQIMYAARPMILELTGKSGFNDQYFTQSLLPNYVEAHPDECRDWDVVWDARGHFTEPHTNHSVPLGTLEVRQYLGLRPWHDGLAIERSASFETAGPKNRFKNVLFIEKEGFDPLLASAHIAERFDLAIMSTKGMSVTAARLLLDRIAPDIENVFLLHDFDISGFSIAGTLGTDGRRYRFENSVRIVDLGLRLADVEAMALESEPVAITAREWESRSLTLKRHGATAAEIRFLADRRVELNAMTSPQFIAFIETKLAEHDVSKLIPTTAVLEAHWRRQLAERSAVKAFEEIRARCEAEAKAATAPTNLDQQVADILRRHPELSWDRAIAWHLVDGGDAP